MVEFARIAGVCYDDLVPLLNFLSSNHVIVLETNHQDGLCLLRNEIRCPCIPIASQCWWSRQFRLLAWKACSPSESHAANLDMSRNSISKFEIEWGNN